MNPREGMIMARRTRWMKDKRISHESLADEDAAEAFGNGDLLAEMRKTLAERMLDAESCVLRVSLSSCPCTLEWSLWND